MNSLGSKLKRWLLAMATIGTVLSAAAQPAGQDIIFSAPQTDGNQNVAPTLQPQGVELPNLPSSLLAPTPAFPARPSDEPMRPPANTTEQQRLKKMEDERRNWMLMTPAEIFGVTPTEKLLQPVERDAFGREKSKSVMERYLDRQNQMQAGPTNSWRRDRANSPWGNLREGEDDSEFARRRYGTADSAQNLNEFLDRQQKKNTSVNIDENFQRKVFDPFTHKKETEAKLEQQAVMQRFREMLNPSSEPATPSPNSRYFAAPKPVVNPNLTHPEYVPNPAGASFKPLINSMGRPIGLTPLPGVVTARQQPEVIPSWKPKPPPWLSQQQTAFPKQKF